MMQKNAFEELGIIDFNKLNQIQQSIQPISLGCPIFDSFLKGGLRPNLLTEICGEAGSGKSQLALQIMLNATLNETKDTIENYSYYISTQKPLNDTRLNQLKLAFLQRNRLKNPRDLDNHLILKHATNLHDFNFWLSSDLSQRLEENNKIKVLVIDTIAGICNEFISNSRGSSNYDTLERRNFLVKTSQLLKKFAHQHNLAVIVLNNVTSNINEDADIRKEKLVPALGLIWSNMVNERFKMKRLKTHASRNMGDNDLVKEKVKRMFSIKFSPRFPRKKQAFYIENNGVFGWTDG